MATREKDRALAAAVVRGERGAGAALFDHVFDRLYRQVCARLGGDHATAEDIVSETLLAGLRGLPAFRGEASLATWFLQIASRKIADHKRQRAATLIGGDGELESLLGEPRLPQDSALDRLVDEETRLLVRKALESLPNRHKIILTWKYFDESSVVDVALRLEVSPKAAERRLARARAALAAALRHRRIDV